MSFGEELRRERELRQISLREISRATKIDLRRLEALEQNDFSGLPGGLYNRSYVRAYCQHIGADADAMVNAYLLEERAQASLPGPFGAAEGLLRGGSTVKTVAAERAEAATAERRRGATPVPRRLALVVAVLLLAAGAVVAWWAVGPRSDVAGAASPPDPVRAGAPDLGGDR